MNQNKSNTDETQAEQNPGLADLEPNADVKGGAERDPLPAILVDPVDPAADKGNRIKIYGLG